MMQLLTPHETLDHQLIDAGDSLRLERFGNNIISRPDMQVIWHKKLPPSIWQTNNASCTKQKQGAYAWTKKTTFNSTWLMSYTPPLSTHKKLQFSLRFSPQSKNIGIFPEQAPNWEWMMQTINQEHEKPNILNLFAYTGGATLCAAAAGAKVCHVDASSAAVTWAQQNHQLNQLPSDSVRWIVDDCSTFLKREIKRKSFYDAIIMDPPIFGRANKTKAFTFEKELYDLLTLTTQVVKKKPLFFIFNGYASSYSATMLKNILFDFYPTASFEWGELHLKQSSSPLTLPCSIFVRFKNSKNG